MLYLNALAHRIRSFIANPVTVLYFVCIIVIIGGFGVWYSAFDYPYCISSFLVDGSTLSSLAIYSISILSGAMAQFLLTPRNGSRGLKIFTFSVFLMGFISALVSITKAIWPFGYLSLLLTWLLWITVYVEDPTIGGDLAGEAADAVGGPDPDIQELPGNLNDFVA